MTLKKGSGSLGCQMKRRSLLRSVRVLLEHSIPIILAAIIAINTIPSTTTYAATDPAATDCPTDFYADNAVTYYDKCAKEPCASNSATSSASLSGNDNLQKIYNYFLGKGLTDIQAAGIVGNISRESGGFPQRKQGRPETELYPDPSGISVGWGIIQWTPGNKVIGIAKQAGTTGSIGDLATQLDIVWWHMNDTTPTGVKNFINQYKTTTDINAATLLYEQKMEAAGSPAMADRYAAAKLAMSYAKSPAASSSNAATDNCSGSGAVVGNAIQTALNYAWPTYHQPPYTTKKKTYDAAIQKAVQAGKYVGGLSYPGVDCGGFITRVMQDSGVDPNYGGGGATDAQLNYLKTSGKYTEIHPKSTADMKPGDIAINLDHTFMYVGSGLTGSNDDGSSAPFESSVASASVSFSGQSWRAPMAGKETPADPSYQWFRLN